MEQYPWTGKITPLDEAAMAAARERQAQLATWLPPTRHSFELLFQGWETGSRSQS